MFESRQNHPYGVRSRWAAIFGGVGDEEGSWGPVMSCSLIWILVTGICLLCESLPRYTHYGLCTFLYMCHIKKKYQKKKINST